MQTIAGWRVRTQPLLSKCVDDKEAFAIGLRCSMLRAEEVVEYAYTSHHLREVLRSKTKMAIGTSEWKALIELRSTLPMLHPERLLAFVRRDAVAAAVGRVEAVMALTLAEPEHRRLWEAPFTKLAALLAAHGTEAAEKMEAIFGTIVRGDLRRLDDMQSAVEDGDCDVMLLSEGVDALMDGFFH